MRRPDEILRGPRLRLERVSAAYADEMAEAVAQSLPELRRFMDWAQDDPSDAADFVEFLEASLDEWERDVSYGYHIFHDDSNELIGGCGLMRRVGPGAIEIGYWIRSDHTERGLATEAGAVLVEAAWALDGIRRLVIRHDLANPASGRVAQKLGFVEVDRVAVEVTAEGESGVDVIRERIRPGVL